MGISPIRLSPVGHSPMAKVHGYIGEIPGGVLAKVQWTFANWQNSRGCIDESIVGAKSLRHLLFCELFYLKRYVENIQIVI
jgi:hypothetical protein